MVDQGGTTAVARMEIDGCILRGALLPTPKAETNPRERQSAHGGLMRLPLVALRLGRDPRPAGLPDRCGGPRDACWPQALGTLAVPVHPRLLAAACGDGRASRLCLPCSGGGRACALFAEGDEPPGGADGAGAGQRREQGKIGMVVRARRHGVRKGLDRVSGDPELVDQGLDESGIGGDTPRIGGQGRGGLDGVEALCNHLCRAHVGVAKAAVQPGAPGAWRRFAGRPAAQKVTDKARVFVLEPLQHMGEIVLQGAREAVGDPPCIPDHTAAVCDAWVERAPRGALRLERLQRVAMGEEQCERECGSGGVVCGPARGAGGALPRQRQRLEGKADQKVIRAPGRDQRPVVAFEADRHGVAVEPEAERAAPRLDGCGGVLERAARAFGGARRLETHILCGSRPVEAHKGSKFVSDTRVMRHLPA